MNVRDSTPDPTDHTVAAGTHGTLEVPTDPPLARSQLALAIVAALAAAVLVPGSAIGVGVGVTWVVAVIAVLGGRPTGSWAGPWRVAMVAVAVAVAGLHVVSDALWVTAPLQLVAGGVLALGLAGGTSWPGMLRPVLRSPVLAVRTIGAVGGGLRSAVPVDARRHPALRGALLTLPLVGGFGLLFASADRVFGRLVERYLLPDLEVDLLPARLVVAAVVLVGVATLVRLRARSHDDRPPTAPARRLHGIEWQLPLGALVALFTGFVAVQFGVLFGGHERVLATAGLTYAEYARGGFAQLVVVAVLTLAVVAATTRYAAASTAAELRWRQVLLAALCLLTVVVLASASHRLSLYQDAFGHTRLRFAAHATIWWLAGVFALLLAAAALGRVRRLPRAVVLLTALAVVAVGYAQPDTLIARWSVDRYLAEGTIDVGYLGGLSADAVPELRRLPTEIRAEVLPAISWRLGEGDDGWMGWNLSRHRAATHLAAPVAHGDATGARAVGRR